MTDRDFAPIGLKRISSATGDATPLRTVTISGRPLHFYPAPPLAVDPPPYVETTSLFDIIGLAPDRRQDFIQRNGFDLPGTANIVLGPDGRIFTLAPGAAWRAVFIARTAGAITAQLADELKAALGVE